MLAQMLPAPDLDQFMTALSKLSPEYAMLNDKLAAMPADNPADDVAGVVQEMTGYLEKFLVEHPEYVRTRPRQTRVDRQRTDALIAALNDGLNPAQAAAMNAVIANFGAHNGTRIATEQLQ